MKFKIGTAILAIAAATGHAQAHNAATETTPAAETADAGNRDASTSNDPGEIVITGQKTTFSNTQVTPAMIDRQSALTSVNDVLNELPGVFVSEGDAFGSSDWATSISIRGFSSGAGGQQIGTTIDGMPNGGSGYGGGSRANRYLDVLDLKTVIVSQGTADISSRSNEALGGTLDYQTSDPAADQRLRFTGAAGDFGARKFYGRYDTGDLGSDTRAYISASTSHVHDWIGGAGVTTRDHVDAKVISRVDTVDLTGFVSYDDADESEFGSVSLAQFRNDPDHDAYTDSWTGIPYIDQSYRAGSRALRRNLFGYLKAATKLGEVSFTLGGYFHHMRGRGDWIPPYLVDVTNDGAGNPESEYLGGRTVIGGDPLGKIYFVTPTGAPAAMIAGCTGSALVPAQSSPDCYPAGSTAVMSYRHTHYKNDRFGFTVDGDWTHDFGDMTNALRAGYWFEHDRSNSLRDWHKITNPLLGIAFDHQPYYVQFSTDYDVDEVMYYAEDVLTYGPLAARVGVKQFFLNQRRAELLNDKRVTELNSHSDPLLSAGLTFETPLPGLELFAGYSQNFAAIGGGPLEQSVREAKRIKPETANNVEIGARYTSGRIQASLTAYDIKFNNHIVSISSNLVSGIDYLEESDSVYLNVGGIKSRGVEAALAYRVAPGLTLSGSYTYNHAVYIGTGDPKQDADIGIAPDVQVMNSPRHMWVASADYRKSVYKAGASVKFVGDRFIGTEGKDVAPNFTLVSAYAGVDLGKINPTLKGLSLTVQGTNLTNERYLAGADYGSGFLGTPRTVSASLTLDF